jgi:MoaA/NifB/PqqE/SkfB family radical SAM enzyme
MSTQNLPPTGTMTSFCARPFYGVHVGIGQNNRCCCKLEIEHKPEKNLVDIDTWWTSDTLLNRIRAQFLNDERPEECKVCWEEEALGMASMRVNTQIKSFDPKVDKIKELSWDVHNKCNLQCKMCSPKYSTGLIKIWDKKAKADLGLVYEDNPMRDDVLKSEAFMTAKSINIAGGEIFLDKRFLHSLLDRLLNSENLKTIFATINGTLVDDVSISKFQLLAEKGIELRFLISIDGPKIQHEYSRNCNYDTILANLRLIKEKIPSVIYSTNYVLTALNASNYLETVLSLKDSDISLFLLSFFSTRFIDVGAEILPKPLIDYYLEKTARDEITFLKYLVTVENNEHLQQVSKNIVAIRKHLIEARDKEVLPWKWGHFCKSMNMFDKKQGKNILEIYPEFTPYWVY